MKKLLAVFLMAALVLSLVACSGASTQQDAKTQTATTDNTNAAKAETQNTNAVKWPEGALTLNCGGKAGGSTDLVSRAFAEYLGKEGIEIERKKVEVNSKDIKTAGNYSFVVSLYGGDTQTVKLVVEAEKKEVKLSEKEISIADTDANTAFAGYAKASSSVYGDLTKDIKIDSSTVKYGAPGKYTVKFTVKEKDGN